MPEPDDTSPTEIEASQSDARLIRNCLQGDEEAWLELIERYKNLIFSIAVRQGLDRQDSVDLFQSVIAELLSELPRLREPKAFQAWLIRITVHKCIHWKRQSRREVQPENWNADELPSPDGDSVPESLIGAIRNEQILRHALSQLAPRCRRLIEMLFYETPPRPYTDVAANLGIKTGSIGFTRRRCLERLRKLLDESGFE